MVNPADMDITPSEVYDAIRRGYTDLADATDAEIMDYFGAVTSTELSGHVANIKGIALEMELARALDAELYEMTNHVGTDIIVDGMDYSVKSGISTQPTLDDLAEGLDVIATSEIADVTDAIDAGITNAELVESVLDAIL